MVSGEREFLMVEPKTTSATKRERRAWSVAEVAARLGVSRNFVLAQISLRCSAREGCGQRVVILTEDVDAYLNNAEQVCGK